MEDLGLRMNYQNSNNPNLEFWNGKKVLITGHTGFKGSWLSLWLHLLGAKVYGISLKPIKVSHYNYLGLNKKIKSKSVIIFFLKTCLSQLFIYFCKKKQ